MALLELKDVTMAFRGTPLLENVNFQIDQGERVCLLGRNGTGKSTLLRLIHGYTSSGDAAAAIEPDGGTITRRQGLRTALLDQDVPIGLGGTVSDVVATAFGSSGHCDKLSADDHRAVDHIISRMELDPQAEVSQLSAGMRRRVLLAKAICARPDILLLDEPTNHLDIAAVAWLEDFLLRYDGTLLFVTHDRMLLRKLATRIIDLDRGTLASWACDYETYLQRKETALQSQARQEALFDKKLAQ